ncbi:MAG: hypothetical protein KF687_18120 [Cyclobacteriaceae bacterium]|nr:hypothetical protein [Cyclobacteriaceae bacterium]
MKRLSLLAVALFSATFLIAQPSVTLLTFGGYTFDDRFNFNLDNGFYGNGRIGGGFQWGVGLEVGMAEESAIELVYQNMQSNVFLQGQVQRLDGTSGINYMMIGGTRYALFSDKVAGFGSLNIGAAWNNPDDDLQTESVTKFAWGGRLGIRVTASEKVSLRIHAQLLSPVQWSGAGFFFGTGGASAGITTGSTIYQFNLGGSLNYKLR